MGPSHNSTIVIILRDSSMIPAFLNFRHNRFPLIFILVNECPYSVILISTFAHINHFTTIKVLVN